jgi:hypothetical protein
MEVDRLYDSTIPRATLKIGSRLVVARGGRLEAHGTTLDGWVRPREKRQEQERHERGTDDFVAAIAKHRHFARETDPSRV